MSKEITLLPDYIDIIQEPSVEFYKTATNLMDVFSTYTGELSVAVGFEKSKVMNDVVNSTSKLYKTLNDSDFKIVADNTTYQLDSIFKMFYIEKFQTLTDNLKSLLTGSFSATNVYFVNYSDDIGNITNTTSIVDSNTSPYFDINNVEYAYPNNVAASLYNKISKNELRTSIDLCTLTDAILKTSVQGLQTAVNGTTANTSHGENLVTDNLYIQRVFEYSDAINSQLKKIIGNMADFVNFFKEVNYRDQDTNRKALFLIYNTKIDSTSIAIDVLRNKLDKSAPNTLTVASSASEIESTRPSTTVDTSIQ
tara:strand:- start:573 stop:1499 length:927 start_codon:yes stop_codon:yes gene_type:complete